MSIKNSSRGKISYLDNKSQILPIFCEIIVDFCKKKSLYLKILAAKKFIFRQLGVNFADFRQNNSVFMQKNRIFE